MTINVSVMNNDTRGANAIIEVTRVGIHPHPNTGKRQTFESRQLYGGQIWTTYLTADIDITIKEIKNG